MVVGPGPSTAAIFVAGLLTSLGHEAVRCGVRALLEPAPRPPPREPEAAPPAVALSPPVAVVAASEAPLCEAGAVSLSLPPAPAARCWGLELALSCSLGLGLVGCVAGYALRACCCAPAAAQPVAPDADGRAGGNVRLRPVRRGGGTLA